MRRTPLLFAAIVTATLPPAVVAQDVKPGGDETITIRGIVGVSMFMQDANFGLGNGQKAQFVTDDIEEDAWWHGGDARNVRLTLGFNGPEVVGDWRANALVEADFFGLFASGGAFGDEQPIPRLRLAWAELTNGRSTFRFGQDFSLTWGYLPVSTSCIGFPLGWGAGGHIGWRFLGAQFHHYLTSPRAGTTAQLRLGVYKNSWVDEPATADDGASAGEAGLPQFEARIDLAGGSRGGTSWGAYLAGHWDRKDIDGVGVSDVADDLDSWAGVIGARVASGRFTLHGNAWLGQAMGHHFGHIVQFRDVGGWGAWAQAGVSLTDTWSLWAFAGTDDPDDEDEDGVPLERTRSIQLMPMIRWQANQLAFGLEWLHSRTDWLAAPEERTGNQIILSGVYNF